MVVSFSWIPYLDCSSFLYQHDLRYLVIFPCLFPTDRNIIEIHPRIEGCIFTHTHDSFECLTLVSSDWISLSLQLWSIYAAGNTVPIPFLKATDISPIALLSGNMIGGQDQDNCGNIAVEAMQELFTSDGPSKKGRSRQNEVLPLALSPAPSFLLYILGAHLLALYCIVGAPSTKCLPETYFKSHINEPSSGVSLPQNVCFINL